MRIIEYKGKIILVAALSIVLAILLYSNQIKVEHESPNINHDVQVIDTPTPTPNPDDQDLQYMRRMETASLIDSHQKANAQLSQTLFKKYSGLPAPKEDANSIQAHEIIFESNSKNSELYELVTYSKSPDELNDFSGGLGFVSAVFYDCSKLTSSCKKTTMIEDANKAGQPGYMVGFGYCFLGWDDVKKRIYSYSCGEGGDGRLFGQFNYETKASRIWESAFGFVAELNEQLSKVAIILLDDKNKVTIEIYETDSPDRPKQIFDLSQFGTVTEDNKHLLYSDLKFKWNTDGNTATFNYLKARYQINSQTGAISKI